MAHNLNISKSKNRQKRYESWSTCTFQTHLEILVSEEGSARGCTQRADGRNVDVRIREHECIDATAHFHTLLGKAAVEIGNVLVRRQD